MADLAKIKRNVAKMAAQGAPIEDIDGYIASQGVTVDEVRAFKPQQATQATPAPSMGIGEDMARSGATGLRQGIEGTVGMFGDAAKMTGDIVGWGAGKLGASPETQDWARTIGRRVNPFGMAATTEEIQSATKPVIGENYQPQTVAGEYARTVGQFAPAAVAGPGSLGRKAAMTVIPALASETAGQATKGTALEPYARGGAALVSGVGVASLGKNAGAVKDMRKNAPSYEAVVADKNTLYTALENAGIQFDAKTYYNMVGRVSHKLRNFNDVDAPLTSRVLKTAKGKVKSGAQSFNDVEDMLSKAKGILREPNASNEDKKAAGILIEELDGFFNKAPLTSNGSIAAENVPIVAAKARELARRSILAREALEIERKSKWYTSGDESGIRNQASSYGKRNEKSMTPMEAKDLKKLVRREGAHGLINSTGSKLTQGILAAAGLAGGAILPLAIGGGISMGSRALSAAMTNAQMKKYLQTVLAGREAQAAALAKKSRGMPIVQPALLGVQAGLYPPTYVNNAKIDSWSAPPVR